MDQPASPPPGPQFQPPPQPQPRPQIHPRPRQNPLQRFSRKTWLLIIGLVVIILAVLVGVSLVKQKQLPWIKGVYGPPTGLPAHQTTDLEAPFTAAAPPDEPENRYLVLQALDNCCLRIRYNYDPYIDLWFQQTGDWVQFNSMWIQANQWYTVCLRDYQESHGYDPTEDTTVAVVTIIDGESRYRNDVSVSSCEVSPTATPTATPTGEPTPTPTPPADEPTPTPTGEPTPTPTPPTPTPTPTPTPPLSGCGESCTYNSDCEGDLVCRDLEGEIKCVNEDCSFDEDCVCGAEPTPTSTPTATPGQGAPEPTATPTSLPEVEKPKELPPTASVQRTILGIVGGVILLLIGLAL